MLGPGTSSWGTPPVEGQTKTENITFPHPSDAGVKSKGPCEKKLKTSDPFELVQDPVATLHSQLPPGSHPGFIGRHGDFKQ